MWIRTPVRTSKALLSLTKGRVLALKGLNLVNQSKYDEAIKVFDEAINASDEALKLGLTLDADSDVKNSRGFILAVKGVALFSQGKYDASINAFDEAIRLDPTNGVQKRAIENLRKRSEELG